MLTYRLYRTTLQTNEVSGTARPILILRGVGVSRHEMLSSG
jgi:hypothetical protein